MKKEKQILHTKKRKWVRPTRKRKMEGKKEERKSKEEEETTCKIRKPERNEKENKNLRKNNKTKNEEKRMRRSQCKWHRKRGVRSCLVWLARTLQSKSEWKEELDGCCRLVFRSEGKSKGRRETKRRRKQEKHSFISFSSECGLFLLFRSFAVVRFHFFFDCSKSQSSSTANKKSKSSFASSSSSDSSSSPNQYDRWPLDLLAISFSFLSYSELAHAGVVVNRFVNSSVIEAVKNYTNRTHDSASTDRSRICISPFSWSLCLMFKIAYLRAFWQIVDSRSARKLAACYPHFPMLPCVDLSSLHPLGAGPDSVFLQIFVSSLCWKNSFCKILHSLIFLLHLFWSFFRIIARSNLSDWAFAVSMRLPSLPLATVLSYLVSLAALDLHSIECKADGLALLSPSVLPQ